MIKKYTPKYKQCPSGSLEKKNLLIKTNSKPAEYNPVKVLTDMSNSNSFKDKNKVYSRLSKPKSIAIRDIKLKKVKSKSEMITSASLKRTEWMKQTIQSQQKSSDENSIDDEQYQRRGNVNDYNSKSQKATIQPTRDETDYCGDQRGMNNYIDDRYSYNQSKENEEGEQEEDSEYEYILIKKKKKEFSLASNPNELRGCYSSNVSLVKHATNGFRNTEVNQKEKSETNKDMLYRVPKQETKNSTKNSNENRVIKPSYVIKAFSNQYRTNEEPDSNDSQQRPPIPQKRITQYQSAKNSKTNESKRKSRHEPSLMEYYIHHPEHYYKVESNNSATDWGIKSDKPSSQYYPRHSYY